MVNPSLWGRDDLPQILGSIEIIFKWVRRFDS
jgi:hypothetical protein